MLGALAVIDMDVCQEDGAESTDIETQESELAEDSRGTVLDAAVDEHETFRGVHDVDRGRGVLAEEVDGWSHLDGAWQEDVGELGLGRGRRTIPDPGGDGAAQDGEEDEPG
jgi:hypothetical protein